MRSLTDRTQAVILYEFTSSRTTKSGVSSESMLDLFQFLFYIKDISKSPYNPFHLQMTLINLSTYGQKMCCGFQII